MRYMLTPARSLHLRVTLRPPWRGSAAFVTHGACCAPAPPPLRKEPDLLPKPRPTLRALLVDHELLMKSPERPDPPAADLTLRAWVRHIRDHKNVVFLSVTDGSLPAGAPPLQVVARGELAQIVREAQIDPGASVELTGSLTTSPTRRGRGGQDQARAHPPSAQLEFHLSQVRRLAPGNPLANPLSTIGVLIDTAREHAHLRFRRTRDAAVLRTRDRIDGAMAQWFRDQDFVHVPAPVITSSDCEGAGEVFQVMSDTDVRETLAALTPHGASPVSGVDACTPPSSLSNTDQPSSAVPDSASPHVSPSSSAQSSPGNASSEHLSLLPAQQSRQRQLARFWGGSPAYLTVSSQLHLEALALSLGRVWTETPSFRAERSATNRHLAEFRMIEAELSFVDAGGDAALDEVMDVVQGVVQAAIRAALLGSEEGHVRPEARVLFEPSRTASTAAAAPPAGHEPAASGPTDADPHHVPLRPSELALEQILTWGGHKRWPRISYTDAVDKLQAHFGEDAAPKWGEGLGSEHERWLASQVAHGPVFVTRYPASIKPFYMRRTDQDLAPRQGVTVDAFDLLVPALGELAGGSLREERPEVLQRQMERAGLSSSSAPTSLESEPEKAGNGKLGWYSDLRLTGSAPHGGFGIGVERLVSVLTHTDNVRDCVPFSTTAGPLRF